MDGWMDGRMDGWGGSAGQARRVMPGQTTGVGRKGGERLRGRWRERGRG